MRPIFSALDTGKMIKLNIMKVIKNYYCVYDGHIGSHKHIPHHLNPLFVSALETLKRNFVGNVRILINILFGRIVVKILHSLVLFTQPWQFPIFVIFPVVGESWLIHSELYFMAMKSFYIPGASRHSRYWCTVTGTFIWKVDRVFNAPRGYARYSGYEIYIVK